MSCFLKHLVHKAKIANGKNHNFRSLNGNESVKSCTKASSCNNHDCESCDKIQNTGMIKQTKKNVNSISVHVANNCEPGRKRK